MIITKGQSGDEFAIHGVTPEEMQQLAKGQLAYANALEIEVHALERKLDAMSPAYNDTIARATLEEERDRLIAKAKLLRGRYRAMVDQLEASTLAKA